MRYPSSRAGEMREFLLNRIAWHLRYTDEGGGIFKLTSSRWLSVYNAFLEMKGLPPAGKMRQHSAQLTFHDLAELTDSQLVEMFELVVRRATICM